MMAYAAREAARREAADAVVERLVAGEISDVEFAAHKARAEHHAVSSFRFESQDDVEAFWERVAKQHVRPLQRSRRKLDAYVNDGRWVADCGECGAGIACSPDHSKAACMQCLTVYSDVRFPDDFDQIERALLVRPPANQHWNLGETIADLRAENDEHGLG